MGAHMWMIVACLSLGLALLESVSGETVPCINSQAECLATGFSSIAIINNNYLCCPPGFSMSAINTVCSCVRTSAEAFSCSQGPKACRNAVSMSSDGQGNTQCCPLGFSMHAQTTSFNGRTFRSCTCTSSGAGGSFQVIGGDGQMISFSGGGGVNTTALGQQLQNWQHRFQLGMNQAMSQLSNSMLTMNRHMQNIGNYMTNIFNSVFRG